MSTKNLARTVIEGGRAHYNKFERRHSITVERAHTHQQEHTLLRAREVEDALFEPRNPVRRSFSDKLGPARRWLRSQVGRPWNKVRSALFTRFDTRTTAGRHIVFDHLLQEVRTNDAVRRWRFEFYVSRDGLLKIDGEPRRVPHKGYRWLPEPEATLRRWLNGRRVMPRGERLYWLEPTPHGGYRQNHELSAAEAARIRAWPSWFQDEITGVPPHPESTN
jgi:hypothetical protein